MAWLIIEEMAGPNGPVLGRDRYLVDNFQEATAELARDLRYTSDDKFRNRVMRSWAASKGNPILFRNGVSSQWLNFRFKR